MIEIAPSSLIDQSQQILQILLQEGAPMITLQVNGHAVQLSQLDQPLINQGEIDSIKPGSITKRELLQYYTLIAPHLLPLLQDRPVTVKRFPDGLTGPAQTERHPLSAPAYVESVEMYSEHTGDNEPFLMCQNLETLLWMIDRNVIEIYPWQSKVTAGDSGLPTIFINSNGTLDMSVANYPDLMVFNLSPSHTAAQQDLSTTVEEFDVVDQDRNRPMDTNWDHVKDSALLLREYLSALGIESSYIKTSGRGGIHVIAPIERQHPYDHIRQAAHKIGQQLVAQQPDLLTMEWKLNDREGKVFIDCNQNVRNKSLLAAYCPRPNRQIAISMPVSWKELEGLGHQEFTLGKFVQLISEEGRGQEPIKISNPWHTLLKHSQELPEILD